MRQVKSSGTRSGNFHGREAARRVWPTTLMAASVAIWLIVMLLPGIAPGFGFEGIRRDTFPVFNDPPMLTAAQAEAQGVIFPRDAVIGVSLGGEAKAYPITIMGYHELGNDTLGGVPIAVSW